MIPELKEDVTHGTKQYPYDQYYLRDIPHAFQIPVHWHEEMEIIYIKEGTLHVRIEGRDYEGKKNDMFFVKKQSKKLRNPKYSSNFALAFEKGTCMHP